MICFFQSVAIIKLLIYQVIIFYIVFINTVIIISSDFKLKLLIMFENCRYLEI